MKRSKKTPNSFFNGGPRSVIGALFIAMGTLFVLVWLTDVSRDVKLIPYSAFLDSVEKNQVKEVFIEGQDVRGKMTDGSRFETVVAENPQDWQFLRKHNVSMVVSGANTYASSWYFLIIITLMAVLGSLWYYVRHVRGGSSNNNGGGAGLFNMGKSRARMFLPSMIKERFDSVAGAGEAKEELQDVVDFLKDPQKYERLGAKITRGVLLIGEPGNGKTLLARAVAGEANCPFFSISGSDFIEVFVGVGASRVRDLFAQARKHAPAIVFIDEIDAVGRHRGSGMGGGHDEREQTLNQLLTEMDGFEVSTSPIIVLAATNRPDVLDKALLRPGRFDRRVLVPFPDLQSREEILKVHAKPIKIDTTVDLHKVARGTPGFSGADLANLLNEAAIIASKAQKDAVSMHDIEEARDKVILGKESKSTILTEQDRKTISYHESGHALVRLLMPEVTDPLHKITIIPRGGALGVTHSIAERDMYLHSKEQLIALAMSALGGRAAEELVFGKLTTGASNDLEKVSSIVRGMVCSYGMAPDELGLVIYSQNYEDYKYSQKTAELIDGVVKDLIAKYYQDTKKLLSDNMDKLDLLAKTLLEKETMYADEVYELLGITPRISHKLID